MLSPPVARGTGMGRPPPVPLGSGVIMIILYVAAEYQPSFLEEAILKMELPKRHATSLTDSRLAPLWSLSVNGPVRRCSTRRCAWLH